MSEPSAKLDLTALSDALEDDDRQAMAEGNEKTKDHLSTVPQISAPSTPANPYQTGGSDNIPAAPKSPARSGESHPDPNVRNIKAMFPDMDVDTIQAVLVADGGDFERAINTLLQMSDPSYVPPPPFQQLSQHDADEQLARSLAAQDERQQHQPVYPSSRGGGLGSLFGGASQQSSVPSKPSYDPNQLNYQPRVKRTISGQQRSTSEFDQNYQGGGGSTYNESSSAPWPGSREAKVWQEDLNKMAEVGFAKAASTFSALRQRGEKAFANVGQSQGGNSTSAGQTQLTSSLAGWSSRKSSSVNPASTVSPTVGSNRGFDKDPTPVDDNELARILARGREDNKRPNITDRYKKVATNSRTQSRDTVSNQGLDDDDDDEELGWDDAGRTGSAAPSFEPIKISSNSESIDATPPSDLKAADKTKLRLSNTPRNAVSLMEGSAGRGLTSPKALSAKGEEDDDDSNDLEYVSNPFEDED